MNTSFTFGKDEVCRLVHRTPPLPGESWASHRVRLTEDNAYSSVSQLDLACLGESIGSTTPNAAYPQDEITIRRIAMAIGAPVDMFLLMLVHRFAPTLTFPEEGISSFELDSSLLQLLAPTLAAKQLRPNSNAQFCPQCLKESRYHRLIWMPVTVSACLQHQTLLVHQCPDCQQNVTLKSIIGNVCSHCEAVLSDSTPLSLSADTLGLAAQETIQSWLLGDKGLPGSPSLPAHSPAVLYRVLDGLRMSIMQRPALEPYLHQVDGLTLDTALLSTTLKPTPEQSYILYTTAYKALTSWPEGFYAFLSAWHTSSTSKTIYNSLGTLYTCWLEEYWQHPTFNFLQAAFETFLIDQIGHSRSLFYTRRYRQTEVLESRSNYLTKRAAARVLAISPSTIRHLIQSKRLTTFLAQDNPDFALVSRPEVMAMRDRWRRGHSMSEAAGQLALSETIVVDLVRSGNLAAEKDPADGFATWLFDIHTIETYSETLGLLLEDPSEVEAKEELLSLADAARKLFVIGGNSVVVLTDVASGKLRAFWNQHDRRIGAMGLLCSDIDSYIATIKAEHNWVGYAEAAQILQVKAKTLQHWVQTKLLAPVATHAHIQYFDRDEVFSFSSRYITSADAASMLGVSKLTVQAWARNGRLRAACGPGVDDLHAYRFERHFIEGWRRERVTFGEAQAMLRVSKATLHRWVDQGKLACLSDMGGKQRWFFRKDVEALTVEKFVS